MIGLKFHLVLGICVGLAGSLYPVQGLETVTKFEEDENSTEFWNQLAQDRLKESLTSSLSKMGTAHSGILVVGAGMSIETMKVARETQSHKARKEMPLVLETFPALGIVKTYCVDGQTGDAACTATAYLSGMKSKLGIIGAPPVGPLSRCGIPDELDQYRIGSIAQWAISSGKSVGIVTTSSVTHPAVAGTYARSTKATWESDADVIEDGMDPVKCPDLAAQLLNNNPGNSFKVILGGGRQNFLPNTTLGGKRLDGRNFITEWMDEKINQKVKYQYVSSREELKNIVLGSEYVFGLFGNENMDYNMQADPSQPTLAEMTEAAIKILSKNSKGYFLFVYGGRIADAHNENKAIIAIDETLELDKAVETARKMTQEDDTLIVVTADLAHTLTISGYSDRRSDIYGEAEGIPDNIIDGVPYFAISYANGPGYRKTNDDGTRKNLLLEPMFQDHDSNFQFPSVFPLEVGTSSGADVAVFANGPYQHLFNGLLEQHLLPHLMAYSMCIGPGLTSCANRTRMVPFVPKISAITTTPSESAKSHTSFVTIFACFLILICSI